MEFDTKPSPHDKKVNMSTFSKSFGDKYEECPLKAWYHIRYKKQETSPEMEFGKLVHMLFAQKIAKEYKNENYNIDLTNYLPQTRFKADVMLSRLNLQYIIEPGDVVLDVESMQKSYLPNGIELIGIFDLVLLKHNNGNPYIKIFDLKTGRKVAKEIDLQCMIYVYLASLIWPGFDISFSVYSAMTGDTWGKYFSEKEALSIKDYLLDYSSKIKVDMESVYMPLAKADSTKCRKCPYFDICGNAAEPESVDYWMTEYQKGLVITKIAKDKLKEIRQNASEKVVSSSCHYVDFSESVSNGFANRSISKKDLLVMLASRRSGLESIIDSLDLNLTEQVVSIAKAEFGIPFKTNIRTNLEIKSLSSAEEDSDEDE